MKNKLTVMIEKLENKTAKPTMTTKEIQSRIDGFPLYSTKETDDLVGHLTTILTAMNERIAELEAHVDSLMKDLPGDEQMEENRL